MNKEYKGCRISFEESKDCFIAYQDGEQIASNVSLQALKKQIDMLKKKTFTRIPIYYFKYSEVEEGEITSFNSLQEEVWVSYGKEKIREKVKLGWESEKLVRKTEENISLVTTIIKNLSIVEELNEKNEKLTKKLKVYTYKELCKLSGQTEIKE